MTHTLIASIDRAGDHVLVLGVLALIAAAAGFVYGLVELAGRKRARRTRSPRNSEGAEGTKR